MKVKEEVKVSPLYNPPPLTAPKMAVFHLHEEKYSGLRIFYWSSCKKLKLETQVRKALRPLSQHSPQKSFLFLWLTDEIPTIWDWTFECTKMEQTFWPVFILGYSD